ncbi:CopD family protein [Halorarius litoreus]|uniref:CopD family protein n=1 Tax=Halorarius litoreus TaxID=2962676 RepID=UPI0020CD03C5|nr:CopD family protein [Halorarius litoreus]
MDTGFVALQLGNIDLTVSYVVHMLFGALMSGAVLFFAYGVNPVAHAGNMGPDTLATATSKLTTVTRASAVLVFLTGGHQAGVLYTFESLTGSGRGYLVLAMLVLWLAMVAFVEMGASKLREGTDRDKVRTPAREARPFLRLASVAAVLVLVDAGLLAAGVAF